MSDTEMVSTRDIIIESGFLVKKLNECDLILKLSLARTIAASMAVVASIAAAITAAVRFTTGPESILLIAIALLLGVFSVFTRLYANRRSFRKALRIIRREYEYLARVIDGEIAVFEESVQSRNLESERARDHFQVVCLRAVRYGLILKANRIKELLATGNWEDALKGRALASNPFPIQSSVTEEPETIIRVDELGGKITSMIERLKADAAIESNSHSKLQQAA